MEFTKVMEIKERMCLNLECVVCPLWEENNDRRIPCHIFMAKHPAETEQILIEWDKAHPVKTFLSDFLEKYPNAPLNDDGTPAMVCPYQVGYTKDCDCGYMTNCPACWNRPLEVQE